jgi:large subunit ribosomal protein L24
MQRIRKGDLVQVVTGGEWQKGETPKRKQGRVLAVDTLKGRVRVEGVRMQKRHLKPGRKGARQGGIVEQEGFIAISNVMLIDPADGKPSRVRIEEQGGQRVRVFTRSGDAVPVPQAD